MSNTGGPFPRYPKRMQDQLDKIKGKKPERTIVAYGFLSCTKCYMDVSVEEAHRRYCEYITELDEVPPTFNFFTKNMKHFTFEDEFTVYDIEVPDE